MLSVLFSVGDCYSATETRLLPTLLAHLPTLSSKILLLLLQDLFRNLENLWNRHREQREGRERHSVTCLHRPAAFSFPVPPSSSLSPPFCLHAPPLGLELADWLESPRKRSVPMLQSRWWAGMDGRRCLRRISRVFFLKLAYSCRFQFLHLSEPIDFARRDRHHHQFVIILRSLQSGLL